MSKNESLVVTYPTHLAAEAAIRELYRARRNELAVHKKYSAEAEHETGQAQR